MASGLPTGSDRAKQAIATPATGKGIVVLRQFALGTVAWLRLQDLLAWTVILDFALAAASSSKGPTSSRQRELVLASCPSSDEIPAG